MKSSAIVPAGSLMLDGMRGSLSRALILMSVAEASLAVATGPGEALRLSPLASAGWLGLLITVPRFRLGSLMVAISHGFFSARGRVLS